MESSVSAHRWYESESLSLRLALTPGRSAPFLPSVDAQKQVMDCTKMAFALFDAGKNAGFMPLLGPLRRRKALLFRNKGLHCVAIAAARFNAVEEPFWAVLFRLIGYLR